MEIVSFLAEGLKEKKMFEVANRRVIVTGAAQGLGKEFVRRLLQVINFHLFFSQKFSFRKSYFISYADKHKTFFVDKS